MKEWVIVGGGVHGCTIATYLLKNKDMKPSDIQIIDPYQKPMQSWRKLTSRIGMDYLRSPVVHHIDPYPFSLEKFAKGTSSLDVFYGYYSKPKLSLFNAHCKHIFDEVKLETCWKVGFVKDLIQQEDHWIVITTDGDEIPSKKVVLAMGVNNRPYYPDWAKVRSEKVFHIFDCDLPSFKGVTLPVVIIGGGITASHLTNKICKDTELPVIQIKRHPTRVHEFDSDPGWIGPKNLNTYSKVKDFNERRRIITDARYRGSTTKSLYRRQKHLEQKKRLNVITSEVSNCWIDEDIHLLLKDGSQIDASYVILATGVEGVLPGKEWLERTIKRYDLKCAECGFPIITHHLEWDKGLHVAGALAELEIGPVSRNISGARKIAERISAM
ncbi:FAD/NAD(P)-binding protein [Pseudalkalibacillus sp. Hm43]|uniref:FAD/NAD(P)-binding protein n=1 Tax=Pseudalkalibacillus sp. Hm43 TaxID=3450742 RepID=UPI003F420A7D